MKKSLLAIPALVASLSLGITPGAAGTATDPEITDVAGDANGLSSTTGAQNDTRPGSFDNLDLLAIWYETAYDTNRITDPATGEVLRVDYVPTALKINVKTQAPIHPTWQGRQVNYHVLATLPDCQVFFDLKADASGVAADTANIWVSTAGCGTRAVGSGSPSPISPTVNGNVATIAFPLGHPNVADFFGDGSTIQGSSARSIALASLANTRLIADATAAGRSFTVGQDVPADVNCTATPDHTECQ